MAEIKKEKKQKVDKKQQEHPTVIKGREANKNLMNLTSKIIQDSFKKAAEKSKARLERKYGPIERENDE